MERLQCVGIIAMTAVTKRPIAKLTDKQREKWQRETWNLCACLGEAARSAGLSIDDVPPFKEEDMQISWRIGWRHEDERRMRLAK